MSRLAADLSRLMRRDLDRLAEQIRSYPEEESLWRIEGEGVSSGGSLALHVVGTLEHYVGTVLGVTGYVRDRDAEFHDRSVTRAEILDRIAACKEMIATVLGAMDDATLCGPYPGALPLHLPGATTRMFLLHLMGHLTWHLGQIDYHRRILGARTG